MDTLSSTVSTLKIPSLPPTTNRESHHHFTRTPHASATPTTRPPHPQPHLLVPSKTKTFLHNKSLSFSSSSSSSSSNTSPLKFKQSPPPLFHHNPATGYAAAIIDVAQKTNSLHSVQRDVHRLLKFLQHIKFQSDLVDPTRIEEIKGEAMRKVVLVEKGKKFHGHVVALVKMLMKKKKLGIVEQVLEEFERIYDELCGTQVVLVSSVKKMGEDELLGIAKSVQQLSGAVRVKVRNLVQDQERFPSFAV